MTIQDMKNIFPMDSARFICIGPFTLDLESRQLLVNNRLTPLPPCTFNYLVTLLRHSPEPVSFKNLVIESQQKKLTQLEAQDLARLNIYMLRRAIEPDILHPRYILTIADYGYRVAY